MRRLAVLLCAVLVAACGAKDSASPYVDIRTSADTDGFRGAGLDKPYALPSAEFVDTNGQIVSWPATRLPFAVTVVLFAYTHCPDVCNTQLADFAAARRGLTDVEKANVGLVMITTDPKRDSAAAIRRYLDRFDSSFVGLRTDDATLSAVAESLGVGLTGIEAKPNGGYEVGHGAQLIGFNAEQSAPVIWLPGTPVADIRHDLKVLLNS